MSNAQPSPDAAATEAPRVPLAVSPPRAECRIDLAALRHNVRELTSRLASGAQLWAVVKANAYGHDVEQVADVAIASGARRLCVATLSEAWQLRQDGVRVPILIMGPLDALSMRRAIDLDASFTVLSHAAIDALETVVPSRTGRLARVHLKVDTGMGRWGIPAATAHAALDRLGALQGVEVEGVMTHFATADEPDDDFFDRQRSTFDDVVTLVRDRHPGVVAHAANSAATIRDPLAHFDAVRCGVALYGLSPVQGDAGDIGLRPVMSLRSYVADLRHREPGEGVGYCRTWIAARPATVALVPIGYADGVRRALSNEGAALVGGRRYGYVGNVSMDHLSLLVDDTVRLGDPVTIIGSDGDERITAEEHARIAGTINYEITCAIAGEPRLRRTYATGEPEGDANG